MLHALQDLVMHCGAVMTPYVPTMLALTTVLLETAVKLVPGKNAVVTADKVQIEHTDAMTDEDEAQEHSPCDGAGVAASIEGRKALTSGSLRLLALLLRNYAGAHDLLPLWLRLMPCTEVLLPRVIHEVLGF